jgi:hypothetical protein
MMGDKVLGEKFPHPMLWDFSRLITLQRAWDVFVLTSRNTSYPPKCSFQIGSCMEKERNVISVEPWKLRRETGGDEPSSDHKILPLTGTKVADVWRRRGLSESAYALTKQKRVGCGVTVCSHQKELGVSISSSCLACCYGSQASQQNKLEEGAPDLCGSCLT